MIIGIIGGGASGMTAALFAAKNPCNQVLLFERQARLGRKLQATGNGRCNLTNLHAAEGGYHGEENNFSKYAIESFSPEDTIAWFQELGLYTVAEDSGRVYPYSDQANSVLDILRFSLEQPNIQLKLGAEIEKVKRVDAGFQIETADESIVCDRVIIACGGLAGSKLGGSMAGYKLLRSLGHHCTRLRPALVQVKTDWPEIVSLKGVRANCKAEICLDSAAVAQSSGELQFTEYGLSGPVIFEISRDACQSKGNWTCRLDFLPHLEKAILVEELRKRKQSNLPASELLIGILHNRLGRTLVHDAGISPSVLIRDVDDFYLERVAQNVKSFEIHLTEPLGMDSAQVTAGGIATREFDAATMESTIVPGVYACGEVLDVDGDCGGYNLQWAWSSGRLAGLHAGGIKE